MTHTINVPLARRILAQIHAAPSRWTQGSWLERPYPSDQQAPENTVDNCQTSGCFAGWTVVLAGYKTAGTRILDVEPEVKDTIRRTFDPDAANEPFEDASVRTVAAARLGLTERQAGLLFDGTNTLRDIYRLLGDFTDGEIAMPAAAEQPSWFDLDEDEIYDHFHPRDYDEYDDGDDA